MFSGIIKGIGTIEADVKIKSELIVRSPLFSDMNLSFGSSVAIDGVCLTISQIAGNSLSFSLGEETLKKTLLLKKKTSDKVHIEPALKIGEPLDGHMVQGHVDGIARITKKEFGANLSVLMEFSCLESSLAPLIVEKGSIAINGASLTINYVNKESFGVCLVPYTLEKTCFKYYLVGDLVHIETDIIGRYLLRALDFRK